MEIKEHKIEVLNQAGFILIIGTEPYDCMLVDVSSHFQKLDVVSK